MPRSLAAALLLAPVPALAAEAPKVAIVGLHQVELTTDDQRRAIEGLVASIEGTGKFDALPPSEVAATISGREKVILEEGMLATARANLANGKNAYNQANADEALGYLQAAADEYRFGIPATNTVDELWEAWLYLGTSHLQLDPPDEAAARAAFANAIALAPTRPANPAVFPPQVIELFDAVREELKAVPVTLQIGVDASTPAPGELTVWLDGIQKGKAPVTVAGVLPGEHHVVVRGKGTQGAARVVVPKGEPSSEGQEPPSQAAAVAIRLPTLGDPAKSAMGRSTQVQALYAALGNRAEGLDYVLIAGVDGSVLYLQLLDPESDTFSKTVEIPFVGTADDEAIAAVPLLLGVVGADGRFTASAATAPPIHIGGNSELALLLTQPRDTVPVGPVGDDDDDKPPKKPKTALVLGIVGGAVVAGGLAAGGWLLLGQEPPTTTVPTVTTGTVVVTF